MVIIGNWKIGHAVTKMVPPAAPPWRPSLMKEMGMPSREEDLNCCCSSLRCCTQDLVLSSAQLNADMNLAAPTPVLLKPFTMSEPVWVANVIAIFSSRFIFARSCVTRSSIGCSAFSHVRSLSGTRSGCGAAVTQGASSSSSSSSALATRAIVRAAQGVAARFGVQFFEALKLVRIFLVCPAPGNPEV